MALEESGLQLVAEGSSEFDSALQSANDSVASFAGAAEGAGPTFDAFGEIVTGALRAVGEAAVGLALEAGAALVSFFSDALGGALDAEVGLARLTAQIDAQGESAAVTKEEALALADEYKNLVGGSDDAVIAAEAVLLKFNQIGSETFPDAIRASADLAALMGVDVTTAAQQLGLALDTGGEGLARIAKQTGAFTDAELEQIKAMREAGDIAGAQALILSNLDDAIGGTAEALANTTAGSWTIFKETIADAGEGVVTSLLPALNTLMMTYLVPLIPIIQGVADTLGSGLSYLLSFATGARDLSAALNEFGILEFLAQAFGVQLPEGLQAADEALSAISDFITGTFMPALSSIWEQTGAELPTAQQIFESVSAAINTALTNVSTFITGTLIPIMESAVAWTVENWPIIQAKIEEVMAGVQSVIDTVLTWALAFWTEHGDSVITIVTAFIEQTRDTIETTLNIIQVFWGAFGDTILLIVGNMASAVGAVIDLFAAILDRDFDGIKESLETLWTDLWESVKSILGSAVEFILGLMGQTTEEFISNWRGTFELAQTIVEVVWGNIVSTISGAISGIINSISAAISWVGSFIDKILSIPPLPDWLTPGSPTPFEMGLWGIAESLKDVTGLIRDLSASFPSLNASVGAFGSAMITPPATPGQIAGGAMSNSYTSSPAFNLNVNTSKPAQSIQHEFAVMQTLYGMGLS